MSGSAQTVAQGLKKGTCSALSVAKKSSWNLSRRKKQRKRDQRLLVWSLEYIYSNHTEQPETEWPFCQSKLLQGNGSVGWPRYASHACTSNTIVLSGRLAEYYRSRASIIIFRKSSDWIRSGSPFDIESSANFPLRECERSVTTGNYLSFDFHSCLFSPFFLLIPPLWLLIC